ncbi:thioredoxin domain-containing protein [Flavobacterium hibisci]|uniref:thioredoxin domain-containing protein n=1 Tax=Flavobacterium hibisci TaxID=1914462 RepID=UPI001CC0FD1A|nr:thioredoxin domain-containing protein [Flavobacterium hibisci]MBZ4042604.1 thioredoxin domain-containing protein [Flavobacterium hibisci]
MNSNFDFLFNYLEKEEIPFDKSEFLFQVQSHPQYPNILSIADTLSFFNIENGVIEVAISDIELLPDSFITFLKEGADNVKAFFVTKKDGYYHCSYERKTKILDINELKALWSGIVFLVEKSENEFETKAKKNTFWWLKLLIFFCLFAIILYCFSPNFQSFLFFIFPILGLVFSLAALKDLFDTKSELLDNFCNMTAATSCTDVLGSTKWKIFKFFSFGDLSVVFFSTQFVGFLLFIFRLNETLFFDLQKILLLCSVPVLFTSIYYQKFVEKKWCPICLIIIGVFLLEIIYVEIRHRSSFNFHIHSFIIFAFTFTLVSTCWFILKQLLLKLKSLKEFQIKGNRFMRNYEIFKNNLVASQAIQSIPFQSQETIILGNPDAILKIIVVTSPFCGFCKVVHEVIEEIIDKYSEKVCFQIYFNFNNNSNDNESKMIHHKLMSIYFNQGSKVFMKALGDWYNKKNEIKIIGDSVINSNLNLDLILEKQFEWCQLNGINYTPAIIIRGYLLPKQYDKKDLIYFINDLSEDHEF